VPDGQQQSTLAAPERTARLAAAGSVAAGQDQHPRGAVVGFELAEHRDAVLDAAARRRGGWWLVAGGIAQLNLPVAIITKSEGTLAGPFAFG
jgi:hypothetical protein